MRIRREALEELAAQKEQVLTRAFPLLETAEEGNGAAAPADGSATSSTATAEAAASDLDTLLGIGGDDA